MTPDVIPFDGGSGDQSDELAGTAGELINALVVGAPGGAPRPIRSRPGIRTWSRMSGGSSAVAPIVAMEIVNDHLIFISDDGAGTRDVFDLTPTNFQLLLSGAPDGRIDGTGPVTLALGHDMLIATGGGAPQKIGPGVSVRLGGSPPIASFATFIAQYLVLVRPDTSGVFFYSEPGVGGVESWDTSLNFAEAEARPDKIVTCTSTSRELYILGETTSQLFLPDENFVFAPSSVLETGCLAARSVIADENTVYWMDTRKRFIVSDLRGFQDLTNSGVMKAIDEMTVVSDIWGFRCKIGRHDLRVWSCPTAGKTFCFDVISQTWSEWRRWDEDRWLPWAPTSYLWIPSSQTHVVGMPDGTIMELTLDAHTDAGDEICWEAVTGLRGGVGKRHCVEAQFPMRRGSAASASSTVDVSWRDDFGDFLPKVRLSLGLPGNYDSVGIVCPAGEPYRKRQWKLSGSAAEAFFIGPGKELFEEVDF